MKKLILILFFIFSSINSIIAENFNNFDVTEGDKNANIKIYIYSSLTCPHCANFHTKIYPNLKKDFVDNGKVKIYFKNFPLDLAALNAAKINACLKSDKKLAFLDTLYEKQKIWTSGSTIEDINNNIKKLVDKMNINEFDFEKCLNNKEVEDWILEERIGAVQKYDIKSTPTIIINEKKFEKTLDYKNLKKAIEKLI